MDEGELVLEAAELADVGVSMGVDGVHDRAGAEEEAGLEEGVGEDVEDARREGARSRPPRT